MCVVVGQTRVMHHRMGWGPRAAGMLGEPEWGAMVEGWGDREQRSSVMLLSVGPRQAGGWGVRASLLLGAEGGTVPLHALAPCQLVENLARQRHHELPVLHPPPALE